MSLVLHAGAHEVSYDELRNAPIPAATDSHVPLAHFRLVETVKYALGFFGHEVVEEQHGITEDGMRYFGALSLRSDYGDYTDVCGLRNSNDKTFPIGIAFGAKVFVCDNLSFHAAHVVKRKHTANARRDLPGLVSELVEPLRLQRQSQHECFQRYRLRAITEQEADHAVLTMYRKGVLNLQRVPEVLTQFEHPSHDWGDKTAWRLFNAATFALSGKVAERPTLTKALHQIIDGVCEPVH